MNESLRFSIILTKVTFVIVSVASLMLDSTCFVIGLPLGTFIIAHVLVNCHFEAFVALSRSSEFFLSNPDYPVCQTEPSGFDRLASMLLLLDNRLYCGLFYKRSTFFEISFFCLLESFAWSFFLLGHSDEKCPNVEHSNHLT
jgi:hypothetical protein